jgi:hypothetical protein
MQFVVEPKAEEFFASATGVCVYVNVRGRAVRVQFESAGGPGIAPGAAQDSGAAEAIGAAASALARHGVRLQPLFDTVALELAARHS